MTVEDWEVGALYWRLVDEGASPEEAAEKVKQKFLGEICAPEKETYFYVGTVLKWPKSWVVIGAFYPRYGKSGSPIGRTGELFTRRRWEFIQKTGTVLYRNPPLPILGASTKAALRRDPWTEARRPLSGISVDVAPQYMQAPLTGFMPESSRTLRRREASRRSGSRRERSRLP